MRSVIDPESRLWFAIAVSLVLHSLLLTALSMKSSLTRAFHPAVYGLGNGFSIVQFVSATSESPAQNPVQGEATPALGAVPSSLPSSSAEVSENPSIMQEQPEQQAAIEFSTSPEAQLTEDSPITIHQPEPVVVAATGKPSGIGDSADGTSTGNSDGEGSIRPGNASGPAKQGVAGNSYGVPAYLRNPLPPYPRIARERGWEGTTLLQVEVLDDGTGGDIAIVRSSGHDILDNAALAAVRHWKFLPARSGDTAIRSLVEIPIRFQMTGN